MCLAIGHELSREPDLCDAHPESRVQEPDVSTSCFEGEARAVTAICALTFCSNMIAMWNPASCAGAYVTEFPHYLPCAETEASPPGAYSLEKRCIRISPSES
jgi:hypothetical protein